MAKKDLDKLAETLNEKLKFSSQAYRDLVANYEPHVFIIDERDIKKQVRQELRNILGYPKRKRLPKELETIIIREVPKMCANLYRSFNPSKFNTDTKNYYTSDLTGTVKKFQFRLAAKEGRREKVFSYFRTSKQNAQRSFIKQLDSVLAKMNEDRDDNSKYRRLLTKDKKGREVVSAFLDIGHEGDTTVATARSQAASEIILGFFNDPNNDSAARKFVSEIFETFFVQIDKAPGKGSKITEYKARLESSSGNKSKAFQDAERAGNLQEHLNKLLSTYAEEFATNRGSDSPVEVVEKRILNQFHSIGTQKRRKTNIKNQKINNAKSSGRSKKSKNKMGSRPNFKESATKINRNKKGIASSPLQLLSVLNNQLPNIVAKNMGSPGLEYRTGRFANSVRVTDIAITAQGFPSIGYTYQKAPYQTFEKGYKQGSIDRDPRKLIDTSIREIAAQFAMGRFYTRRV